MPLDAPLVKKAWRKSWDRRSRTRPRTKRRRRSWQMAMSFLPRQGKAQWLAEAKKYRGYCLRTPR